MKRLSSFKRVAIIMIACGAVAFAVSCDKTPAPQKAAETKAYVTFAIGECEITHEGIAKPAQIMDRIFEGDIVKTGKKSQLSVQISEGVVAMIQPNSEVAMKALFAHQEAELNIARGEVLAKVARLQKGEKFQIKTPVAVAAVRGTEFSASYLYGKNVFAVREGKVAVSLDMPAENPETTADAKVDEKPGEMKAAPNETVIDAGKSAVIKDEDVKEIIEAAKEAAKEEKPDSQKDVQKDAQKDDQKDSQKDGKKEEKKSPVKEAPVIVVRDSTAAEKMKLDKIEIVTIVEKIEDKKQEEVKVLQAPAVEQAQKMEEKIVKEVKKEKIEELIVSKTNSIEEIKETFDRIDEIYLYNGQVIRGAIAKRGPVFTVITMKGTVMVEQSQIRNVRIIR
jgi:hypothetical protein